MPIAERWETLDNWNAKVPSGWSGRDGLLYEREEGANPAYDQLEIHNATVISDIRSRQRECACGCGEMAPKSGHEFLAYIPGHNRHMHWRRLRAVSR